MPLNCTLSCERCQNWQETTAYNAYPNSNINPICPTLKHNESQKLFSYFLPPNLAIRKPVPFLHQSTGSGLVTGISA